MWRSFTLEGFQAVSSSVDAVAVRTFTLVLVYCITVSILDGSG